MADSNVCPKCGGNMAEGMLRKTGQYGGESPYIWAPVDDIPFALAGHPTGRAAIHIYRCEQCGFSEMYAPTSS